MENNKLKTFIGFAIRANKYRTGINSIGSLKRAQILIVCKSTTENSIKEILKTAKKLNAKVYITTEVFLSELTHKQDVKVIAITDKNLADAIIDSSNDQLKFFA